MDRKKEYHKWARKHAGRCRTCGTVYIPTGSKDSQDQVGDLEEIQFCEQCALRCPHCLEWLPVIRAEVQNLFNYYLMRNDRTGKFYPYDEKCQEQKVVNVECPWCGRELDQNLLEF